MMAKIEIISKELIKPSVPTPHENKELKLSFLDQLLRPGYYITLIFFYQNHQGSSSCSTTIDHVKRSQLLKQSLSEVLAIFYPLAGRIGVGNHLFIDCNDSGALFVKTRVHSRLTKETIPIDELNRYLPLEPYTSNSVGNNTPLLAIQYNSFECGGTAIGVCISHKVADLMSLMTFMISWGAKTSGKDEEIVIPDFHLGSNLFPQLDKGSFPAGSEEESGKTAKTENYVTKRLVFDKEKIAALKEEASSGGALVKDPTRVEAVSAFLWKHFIAISSESKAKTMFTAYIAVNLRPRMSLPPETFAFGNHVALTPALLMPSGEEDQEYHNLVCLMRTAIRKIDSDYINIVRSGFPYLRKISKDFELCSKKEMSYCIFSSWCRFPVYQVDYGWGKPVSVSTVVSPGESVTLMPTRCGEGIEAWVSMLESEMALLPDELLSLATCDIITICPSKQRP